MARVSRRRSWHRPRTNGPYGPSTPAREWRSVESALSRRRSRLELLSSRNGRSLPSMVRTAMITALLFAALAAPASADVLVSAIPKHLVCGDAITPGIWAQPRTRGSRRIKIKVIDARSGTVWWRKTAYAPTRHWRDWYLPSGMDGQCGRTIVVYTARAWTARYTVRFRGEGV